MEYINTKDNYVADSVSRMDDQSYRDLVLLYINRGNHMNNCTVKAHLSNITYTTIFDRDTTATETTGCIGHSLSETNLLLNQHTYQR